MEEKPKEILEKDEEDNIFEYFHTDFTQLFVVKGNDGNYNSWLHFFNEEIGVCFVIELKRYGTDAEILGQKVHNELEFMVHDLSKQIIQIDDDQDDFKMFDAVPDNSINLEGLKLLETKLQNNKVFMVMANNTRH